MITVQDIMADPLFKGFRIVAGHKGLYNEVLGTGIFDWEEPEDMARTFSRREFIITTLSEAKYRPDDLLRRFKALLEKHASVVCIKTLFYKSVPKEIIRLANEKNVPIFLFEDTYTDDIIFVVRNALQEDVTRDVAAEKIEDLLLSEEPSREESAKAMKRASPFLYEHYLCMYATPRYHKDQRIGTLVVEQCEKAREYFQTQCSNFENSFSVAIRLRDSFIIIFSMKAADEQSVFQSAEKIVLALDMRKKLFIGFSNVHHKHNEFSFALKESMYANISASVDREATLKYCDLGMDSLLIPICNHSWIRTVYEREVDKLNEYDRKHNARLFETLMTYAESEGSISLTATKMLQHENTIRRRLERIRTIIGTDKPEDAYVHMYLLARLYKILQVMINL
ncbi:PucR family transcriptional regulator ligand-binding domain-containing protein [Anaerovorax odorimutans]|uniref:PucR family transcriptional regulator ligand-binding domain-containing protein n=1 Tax=Anaerovorax odorimutans TaxID=109327 RepID=A0ABT1RNF8_9FIRM|nr:PucR family transcriptional regulator [Anaerovorax odorimutans]MCQ4636733.1 PucR family transcriptional regulator ligand-binding domain-containing protein [Anaerovorax odorimutans]